MDKYKTEHIIRDREVCGLSFRNLANKYRLPLSTIHSVVKKNTQAGKRAAARKAPEMISDELASLKAQLRQEQLRNELLNNMIDIASKELGIDIRKKSGTRQSE